MRSAAYILRFENEYASNACSRDDSLDTLRGLLTAGPGEGPAFEPGSLHGQFLEVVLLAGREGETDEGMSDEVRGYKESGNVKIWAFIPSWF